MDSTPTTFDDLIHHIDTIVDQRIAAAQLVADRTVKESMGPRPSESGYLTRFQAICALVALTLTLGGIAITLKTDISTLQYQAQIGISDRASLHVQVESTREGQNSLAKDILNSNTQILTRLTRLEVLVTQGQQQSAFNKGSR